MKQIIITLLLILTSQSWAEQEAPVVPQHIDVIARIIQSQLPQKAYDGLFEAKRLTSRWIYTYWVRYDKTWVDQVEITLTALSPKETRIQIDASRIEQGMVFRSKKRDEDLIRTTANWVQEETKKAEPAGGAYFLPGGGKKFAHP